MKKGASVVVKKGKDAGKKGTVFWYGKNKFGEGMRVGLKTEDGETVWAGETDVEAAGDAKAAEASSGQGESGRQGSGSSGDSRKGGQDERAAQDTGNDEKGGLPDPFLFYGDYPDDWIEGASDGHAFSVQFVDPPGPQQLEAIANLYESLLSKGMASPGAEPWQWSQRFAHFCVGERGMVGPGILWPVKHFLRQAHEIAPIRDVVYLNAREHAQATDASRPPDPGPAGWQYPGVFRRALDPSLPPLLPIPEFEQARIRSGRSARARDTLEQIEAEIKKQAGKKGIRLEHHDGKGPQSRSWSRQELELFHNPLITRAERFSDSGYVPGDHVIEGLGQVPLAWVVARPGWDVATLAYILDGRRREVDLPDGIRSPCCVDAHPDGQRLLLGGQDLILEVTLASGETRPRRYPALGERLLSLRYLYDGCWSALTRDRLYVMRSGEGDDALIDMIDVKRDRLQTVLGGKVIVAHGSLGQPEFYGFAHDQLKKLGFTRAKVDTVVEHESRLLAGLDSVPGVWYRVAGLREAVDKLERTRPRKQKARPAIIQMKTHETLPEDLRSSALSSSLVEQSNAWMERFKARFGSAIESFGSGLQTWQTSEAPDGKLAVAFDSTRIGLSRHEGHFEALSRLKKHQEIRQLMFDPTGRYLFLSTRQNRIYRIEVDPPNGRYSLEDVVDEPSLALMFCVIDPNRLLGFYYDGVCLILRENGAWSVQAKKRITPADKCSFCSQLETMFTFHKIKGGVTAYAAKGNQLESVWSTTNNFVRATFVGSRVFMHPNWVNQLPAVELVDFAETFGIAT